MQFDAKKASRFLPYVLLIGIGIGSANYLMFEQFNWIQWVIQSLSTSFLIGYSSLIIASNKPWVEHHLQPDWKLYLVLTGIFCGLGLLATEVEYMIRTLIFSAEEYQPFSGGKTYVFNAIISLALGLSFFLNGHFFAGNTSGKEKESQEAPDSMPETESPAEPSSPILKVPVKQGDTILLLATKDIVYFEAFDNYSFVYTRNGEKKLCDYSLLFLQQRLGDQFLRVHRKYIVNISFIKQIRPHSNSRYLMEFEAEGISPIVSSKSYTAAIRSLIKIT